MCDSNELKNYFHRFIFVWIYTDFFNFNIFLQNGSWNYLLIMKSLYTYIVCVCVGGVFKKNCYRSKSNLSLSILHI